MDGSFTNNNNNNDIGSPATTYNISYSNRGGDDDHIKMMNDERYGRIIQTTVIGLGYVFDSTYNNNTNSIHCHHYDDVVIIDEYLPVLSTLIKLFLSPSSLRRSCYVLVGRIMSPLSE